MKIGLSLFGLLAFIGNAAAQTQRFEYAPIHYHTRVVTNAVSAVSLDQLKYEPEHGYLKSVLEALDISPLSQTLVFSSTSFQKDKITPTTPRALYFNDTSYVGWIPGADLLEIISIDPFLGPVFYDIRQAPQTPVTINRNNTDCLDCHSSARTQSVPGLFIRSSYPKDGGRVAGRTTSHQTELEERWGGWYVTGKTGSAVHRGNLPDPDVGENRFNMSDLSAFFDTGQFLTPHSDVLALMVLEHQCHMFNLINRANYRVRLVMHDEKYDPENVGDLPVRVEQEIKRQAPALVRNLLFTGETELTEPVEGDSGFAAHFQSLGPRDRQGRSLRELDGTSRLFKYPCSYMIYTDSFKMLPPAFKVEVFDMLRTIINRPGSTGDYAHLSEEDKQALYEILSETVAGFSKVWD